jgi:hypothetical protein
MREPRYSGPERTGVCVCGCPWDKHHLCMVMRQDYLDATQEQYIPDECCAYGFNEVGGMKYNKELGEWEDHCHGYRDSGTHCPECGMKKPDHKMSCDYVSPS